MVLILQKQIMLTIRYVVYFSYIRIFLMIKIYFALPSMSLNVCSWCKLQSRIKKLVFLILFILIYHHLQLSVTQKEPGTLWQQDQSSYHYATAISNKIMTCKKKITKGVEIQRNTQAFRILQHKSPLVKCARSDNISHQSQNIKVISV